jgi:hypothetical protein
MVMPRARARYTQTTCADTEHRDPTAHQILIWHSGCNFTHTQTNVVLCIAEWRVLLEQRRVFFFQKS